jgi:hypothetical protein
VSRACPGGDHRDRDGSSLDIDPSFPMLPPAKQLAHSYSQLPATCSLTDCEARLWHRTFMTKLCLIRYAQFILPLSDTALPHHAEARVRLQQGQDAVPTQKFVEARGRAQSRYNL